MFVFIVYEVQLWLKCKKLLFILFVLVFIVLKHLPEDSSSKTADWLPHLKVTLI